MLFDTPKPLYLYTTLTNLYGDMMELKQGRKYWTGRIVIDGSAVQFPIALYTVMDKSSTGLNKRSLCCNSFVEYEQHCAKCKTKLDESKIGKGYAIANELIPVDEQMLEAIKPQGTDTIHITGSLDNFPIVYDTDKKYWINVDEKRNKKTKEIEVDSLSRDAYKLLNEGLKMTGKTLIGSTVMRNTEYVVAIQSIEGRLMLSCLYYASNRKQILELEYGKVESEKVKAVARFINEKIPLADLNTFKDNYAENLKHLIMKEPIIQVKETQVKSVADAISMFN